MVRFLLICLGGAVGSGARYLVSLAMLAKFGPAFPYGTLAVNVIGSFLLAVIMQLSITSWMTPTLRMTLATGVMGGFTTYSTFNQETLVMIQNGAWPVAVTNVSATLAGCLLGGACGLMIGRWVTV